MENIENPLNYEICFRNILSIHARLINEGKMSLTFKSPSQLMMLSEANPKHLDILVRAIKDPNYFLNLDLQPISQLNSVTKPKADVKSMTITSLKQYPPITGTGFPKTLHHLSITSMNYRHLDTRICALDQLQTLDLSNNKLKKLPKRLWEMKCLSSLNVSKNEISELPHYIASHYIASQDSLFHTLKYCNLANNKLEEYPAFLRYCTSLIDLNLSGNKINIIANHLKSCSKTLRILHLDSCNLKNLPPCLSDFTLNELKLDDNPFPKPLRVANEVYKERCQAIPVPSLQESCVKCVIRHDITFSPEMVPQHIINYIDSVQYCKGCFKMVLQSSMVYYYPVNLKSFARSFSRLEHAPVMTGFVCSNECFGRVSEGKSVVPACLFFNRSVS